MEQKMRDLFGRYIRNIDELHPGDSPPESDRQPSERIIISVTSTGSSKARFPRELYDHVSSSVYSDDMCVVESLCPAPILSAAVLDVTREHAMSLLRRLSGVSKQFRVVCGMGRVEFGIIGTGPRVAYGSCGDIVSSVVEGAVVLPAEHSWGDEDICRLLNVPQVGGKQVSGRSYFRLDVV